MFEMTYNGPDEVDFYCDACDDDFEFVKVQSYDGYDVQVICPGCEGNLWIGVA